MPIQGRGQVQEPAQEAQREGRGRDSVIAPGKCLSGQLWLPRWLPPNLSQTYPWNIFFVALYEFPSFCFLVKCCHFKCKESGVIWNWERNEKQSRSYSILTSRGGHHDSHLQSYHSDSGGHYVALVWTQLCFLKSQGSALVSWTDCIWPLKR